MRPDLKMLNAQLTMKRKADKAKKEIEWWAIKEYRTGFDDALTLRRPREKELVASIRIEWPVLSLSGDDIAQEMIKDELAYKLGKKIMEFTQIEKDEVIYPEMHSMIYTARVTIVQKGDLK